MKFSASYAAHVKTIDKEQRIEHHNFSLGKGGDDCFRLLTRAMRLTSIFLLIACLQVNARGFGQGTVTISMKDVMVTEVFKAIEKQTPFRFLYRDELVKRAGLVSVFVKDASVNEVLDQCFARKQLDYKIFKETIVISEKAAMAGKVGGGDGMMEVPPKMIDVTGRVLNEQGKPVEGVTVTIKNTSKATTTNANGEFFLSSVEQDAVLVFTSVNMETFELKVSGKTELVVNLKAKVSELGGVEVVVNTGYQQMPKERATGSFAFVSQEQLDQRVAPDILSKLEGITNGLVFNKDPYDGSNKLRIRGESTIFANANPLIILDNFPYDGDINNINPNDVETVTILKDAAAASIWGVQAGNGVIVITTKKGKYNQPLKTELRTNFTIIEKPDLFYQPQINPNDYIEVERFLFDNGKYDAVIDAVEKPALSPIVEILLKKRNGLITDAEAEAEINKYKNHDLRNDILDHLYKKSGNQQYALNLSSGNSKASYYFSIGYDKSLPGLSGNSSDRLTLNTQNYFRPLKKLEIKLAINYAEGRDQRNSLVAGFPPNSYPYMSLVNAAGSDLSVPQRRAEFEDTIANHGFLDWKYYPLQEYRNYDNRGKEYRTNLLAGVKYDLLDGLTAEINYQYTRATNRTRYLAKRESYHVRDLINTYALIDDQGNYIGTNFPDGGILDLGVSDIVGHYGRANLNFTHSWNQHSINAIGGIEVRETRTEESTSTMYGYDDDNGSFVNPDFFAFYPHYFYGSDQLGIGPGLSYQATLNRFRSYFGNVAYSFDNRYIVSGSARLDGSNYFGVKTNQKNIPLWSTGVKWNISNEQFFKSKALSSLALRVAYGYNGNLAQNIAAITTMQYLFNDAYTGLPTAAISNIPNPELRWERLAHFNVGLDFELNRNWLSGSIEYFRKNGNDLIGDAQIDPTTGVQQIRGNFSGMKSNGIDIYLTFRPVRGTVRWTSTFMLNYAKEKITRYDLPEPAINYLAAYKRISPKVGQPLYPLYSLQWGGLDPTTGGPRIYLGDTLNSDYTSAVLNAINEADLVYNGRYNAPLTGGWQNTFIWKGFSLSFNITYKLGHYFRRNGLNYVSLFTSWQAGNAEYSTRWQKPGDETVTNVPSMIYPADPNREAYYSESSILVERADHIRLQFVNLSYNLTSKDLKRLPIEAVQLFVYGNNLGIIWRANDKGIDPDYPYLGNPPSRSWSAGLKVNF